MDARKFNELLERKLSDSRTVLAGKATEYSHGGDRLSNFKRAAKMLNCTPEAALLGFVTKHITALYDFVATLPDGTITLGQWAEKTGDIRNYMLLLDGLIEERVSGVTSEDGCFIIESALNHGFTIVDDDATVFRCTEDSLISLINGYRTVG